MTIRDGIKTITLAAAQMTCNDGDIAGNLAHAGEFVEMAKEARADILVFPEFMPEGFRLTEELWDIGEPTSGTSERWLMENARRTGMYIGASYLRSDGQDFYNTFALAAPDGTIAGRVDKENPSLWEAYFFRGGSGAHVIETELGRIGVGICFDNHVWQVAESIRAAGIDLMLMPHSFFTPNQPSKLVSQSDLDRLKGLPGSVAGLYNRHLGVPVLMVNKSGAWDSPLPTRLFPKADSNRFSGQSQILAANGTVLSKLDLEEGLAVAEVSLAQTKRAEPFAKYSRYIYPGSVGREYIRFVECLARRAYKQSAIRALKAGHASVQ
jgi:N-carbamoylputrescine amidase